jgi:hypothetical protein
VEFPDKVNSVVGVSSEARIDIALKSKCIIVADTSLKVINDPVEGV